MRENLEGPEWSRGDPSMGTWEKREADQSHKTLGLAFPQRNRHGGYFLSLHLWLREILEGRSRPKESPLQPREGTPEASARRERRVPSAAQELPS